jgi:hypothetical protein
VQNASPSTSLFVALESSRFRAARRARFSCSALCNVTRGPWSGRFRSFTFLPTLFFVIVVWGSGGVLVVGIAGALSGATRFAGLTGKGAGACGFEM